MPLGSGSIAVVTGASGFIGSALCEALVSRGVRVRCLTRGRPQGDGARGDVEWHAVDWTDARALDRSTVLDGVGYVFHLAGVTKAASLAAFRAGNVRPVEAVLAAVVRHGPPLERFVLVSSQSAAGPAPALETPRREADTPSPIEAYGTSKLEAERVVSAYGSSLPWSIVRPSSVYGPRDVDFLQVFRQVRSGFWIYPATRERWLSIAHVRDVVDGILLAAEHERAPGRTYFLSGEPPVTWRDVYDAAARAVSGGGGRGGGGDARKFLELDLPQPMVEIAGRLGTLAGRLTGRVGLVNAEKVALGRAKYWVCSTDLARRELGFQAQVRLEEGMRATYEWYRSRGWL